MSLKTLTVAVAAAFAAGSASAATFYVGPTGSGSTCSQAAPCRQIRTALTLVGPNDTILVDYGSYLGFDVDDIDGLPGQPITIRAQGAAAVVTVTNDRPDNRDTIFITFSDWIVIDGLRSSNANRAAVRVDQSDHVTIRNGVFGNNGTWGIFTDFSNDLLIENNTCFGSLGQHGIYVSNSGDRPTVRGNHIYGNAQAGLHMNGDLDSGPDGIISGALVENNVIHGNGGGSPVATGGAAGINMDGVQDSIIRNNLLYDNHATGIVAFRGDGAEGPRGLQILHNTVHQASNGRWALQIFDTTGAIVVRNNALYHPNTARGSLNYGDATDVGNTDSDYNVLDRVSPDGDATIHSLAQWQAMGHEPHSVAPGPLASLWVNAAGGDYHLPAGSPAVDRGLTLPSVAVDIEGTTRPQGASSDAGAYERVQTVPTLAIDDVTVTEGSAGTTPAVFTVRLAPSSAQSVTVSYATANGTATAPADYGAASATLTFAAGQTTRTVTVNVVGDTAVEADETFTVTLSSPSGATLADAQAVGTISDDDAPPLSGLELTHGAALTADLASGPDLYRMAQAPRSSYEVMIDAASGDVSPAALARMAADQSNVLQSAVAVGTGTDRVLRWINASSSAVVNQSIRVTSGGCTTNCGADDTYRVRAWDTTYSIPRFNNAGTQASVLLVQNTVGRPVTGFAYFWSSGGTLLGTLPLNLPARGTQITSVPTVSGTAGQGGSVTIVHDGGYGALAGKTVALELATGFSFDSPMIPRPR
jgi:parallel beta-helix repeat protein